MPTYVSFDTPEEADKFIKSHHLKPSQYDRKELRNKKTGETKIWLEIKRDQTWFPR